MFSCCVYMSMYLTNKQEEGKLCILFGFESILVVHKIVKKILPDEYAIPNVTNIMSDLQVETIEKVCNLFSYTIFQNENLTQTRRTTHLLKIRYLQKQTIHSIVYSCSHQTKRTILFICLLHIIRLLINFILSVINQLLIRYFKCYSVCAI